MVERIAEIDAARREIPQLGYADAEDLAVLAASRWRFSEQRRHMTQAVAHMLERAATAGYELVDLLLQPEAMRTVCAWCHCVRMPGGHWLAIQQYLPKAGVGRLSHGICPECLTREWPDIDPERIPTT